MCTLVNVWASNLKELGYKNFRDWYTRQNTIYIGGDLENCMLGKKTSKWQNPFYFARDISEQTCLKLYEVYVRNEMSEQLSELEGKALGFCCTPYFCHGDVLVELVREMKGEREHEERKVKKRVKLNLYVIPMVLKIYYAITNHDLDINVKVFKTDCKYFFYSTT